MIDDDLIVILSPVPKGCAGRDALCPNPVEYRATLTYCTCGEISPHPDRDPCAGCRDDPCDVALCRRCAAVVRTWPTLTEMTDA